MSTTTKYDLAFPQGALQLDNGDIMPTNQFGESGLTKRELFAAMAMQGMLARSNFSGSFDVLVKHSLRCADALLDQLDKSP